LDADRASGFFMTAHFPYGKAPFWLLVIAVSSTLVGLLVRRQRPPRPELILLTYSRQHQASYQEAIPRFEKERGVRVQLQFANWASLQTRLQSAVLAGTEVPDLVEIFGEGSLGFFTRGPRQDIGLVDLTDRIRAEGLQQRMVTSRFSLWSSRERIYALPHDVHPVMLAYRRDLVEELGIDVRQLDTWDKFIEVGRRVTRDLDGDGIIDRYMLDLPEIGIWGLNSLIFQRGGQYFDSKGEIAFNSPEVAEVFRWYLRQTVGPQRIAYQCDWGQSVARAMITGLVLFYWAPDWRSRVYEDEIPQVKGKMALMPLPAWKEGERRTTVWGGSGLVITKSSKNVALAWELAKFLYFNPEDLGKRFSATNIIPPLKDAWDLPELETPNPYYSNQPIGQMYAELAPTTPPVYSHELDAFARTKLDEAYSRTLQHYRRNGESGLTEAIQAELTRAEIAVKRMVSRGKILSVAQ
jgi:arabinosaccharide transport system substrate-binding protein